MISQKVIAHLRNFWECNFVITSVNEWLTRFSIKEGDLTSIILISCVTWLLHEYKALQRTANISSRWYSHCKSRVLESGVLRIEYQISFNSSYIENRVVPNYVMFHIIHFRLYNFIYSNQVVRKKQEYVISDWIF